MDYDTLHRELLEHRSQSQNLSKLLLKKQGAVLELQAERSALKSRLVDMQTRCVCFLCVVVIVQCWVGVSIVSFLRHIGQRFIPNFGIIF